MALEDEVQTKIIPKVQKCQRRIDYERRSKTFSSSDLSLLKCITCNGYGTYAVLGEKRGCPDYGKFQVPET